MKIRMRPLTWWLGVDPGLGGHSGRAELPPVPQATQVPGASVESRFGLVFLAWEREVRGAAEHHLLWLQVEVSF